MSLELVALAGAPARVRRPRQMMDTLRATFAGAFETLDDAGSCVC